MATKDTQEFNGNDIPEFEETDFILEFNDKLYIRHKDIHCSKPVNVQINWKQITKRAGLQWHQFAKDNLAYQIDTRRTMWCSENAIRLAHKYATNSRNKSLLQNAIDSLHNAHANDPIVDEEDTKNDDDTDEEDEANCIAKAHFEPRDLCSSLQPDITGTAHTKVLEYDVDEAIAYRNQILFEPNTTSSDLRMKPQSMFVVCRNAERVSECIGIITQDKGLTQSVIKFIGANFCVGATISHNSDTVVIQSYCTKTGKLAAHYGQMVALKIGRHPLQPELTFGQTLSNKHTGVLTYIPESYKVWKRKKRTVQCLASYLCAGSLYDIRQQFSALPKCIDSSKVKIFFASIFMLSVVLTLTDIASQYKQIHLDIKLENIFFLNTASMYQVKIKSKKERRLFISCIKTIIGDWEDTREFGVDNRSKLVSTYHGTDGYRYRGDNKSSLKRYSAFQIGSSILRLVVKDFGKIMECLEQLETNRKYSTRIGCLRELYELKQDDGLVNFIESLIHPDDHKRLSLKQILCHEYWYKCGAAKEFIEVYSDGFVEKTAAMELLQKKLNEYEKK
eukprot:103599_1